MLRITVLLFTMFLMFGCGASDGDSDGTTNTTTVNSNTSKSETENDSIFDSLFDSVSEWFSSDEIEDIDTSKSLEESLYALAKKTSLKEFTSAGLDLSVAYVVKDYFPDFMAGFILSFDLLKGENLSQNSTILSNYMKEIYEEANINSSPKRAWFWEDTQEPQETSIVERLIEAIYTYILELLYPAEEPLTPDPQDSYVITPKDSYEFVQEDLNAQSYFVASEQYMSVTFSDDGASGRGDIGFGLGVDFESYISGGKLFIDMDGVYEVSKVYEDPGYCIASTMLDSNTQTLYNAYWFFNEEDYEKAENIKLAESLCYIHSSEYSAPVIAKDGILEPIKDEREGHLPVLPGSTRTMVEELLAGVNNSATIKDAKYFARSMRHGIFSIYTTNEQRDTLQAKESAKIMREVLPLGASSALSLEELMTSAYDLSIDFQEEVNQDLNRSVSEVKNRLDAIITATSQAMDRTVSPNYHGVSDPTIYGDIVDFEATNKDIRLFRNSATADVIIKIQNIQNSEVEADVEFITQVKTTILGDSEVEFSQIDATSSESYIGGVDYKLYITSFNYHRASGVMTLNGNGYLGIDSVLTLRNYDVLANFTETPSLELLNLSVTADGEITTQSGKVFDGVLLFDGENSSNSKMDGVLKGMQSEPVIDGLFETSLDLNDINGWLNDHSELSDSFDNIGEQSYFMKMNITQGEKSVSADMLVNRDDNADTWTYMIKDLLASDTNGEMMAKRLYFIQKGENRLAESFEKIALSGMNLDTDLDMLINLAWDIASDFDNIGVEGLEITMKPSSGDISINATIEMENKNDTMNADLNATYDYDTTHLSAIGRFETLVSRGVDGNNYDNSFVVDGMIKVDNLFNYRYALDYDDIEQYVLFTRDDSSYQMCFVMREYEIKGADSYGVLADFSMNENYDVLESMYLYDSDENELGVYDRSTDRLKIIFKDDSWEYMYLY